MNHIAKDFNGGGNLLKRQGFTLVELSIVLVIIGLLIGGILAGQSMIENVKINRQISEWQSLTIAADNYKTSYGYLPGDDPKSLQVVGAGCCYSAGNGDGLIDATCSSLYCETGFFFPSLYAVGMWKQSLKYGGQPGASVAVGNGVPALFGSKYGSPGPYYFMTSSTANDDVYGNWIHTGYSLQNDGYLRAGWPSGALTTRQAATIDSKIDDGMPLTGDVRASASYTDISFSQVGWLCVNVDGTYDVGNSLWGIDPTSGTQLYCTIATRFKTH